MVTTITIIMKEYYDSVEQPKNSENTSKQNTSMKMSCNIILRRARSENRRPPHNAPQTTTVRPPQDASQNTAGRGK